MKTTVYKPDGYVSHYSTTGAGVHSIYQSKYSKIIDLDKDHQFHQWISDMLSELMKPTPGEKIKGYKPQPKRKCRKNG